MTQNEKLILLHVLLHHFKDSGLHSFSTEYFRVLALSSECIVEEDLFKANTSSTKYRYFYYGKNSSEKSGTEKIKMVDEILNKIESIQNIEKFKNALKKYKNLK